MTPFHSSDISFFGSVATPVLEYPLYLLVNTRHNCFSVQHTCLIVWVICHKHGEVPLSQHHGCQDHSYSRESTTVYLHCSRHGVVASRFTSERPDRVLTLSKTSAVLTVHS